MQQPSQWAQPSLSMDQDMNHQHSYLDGTYQELQMGDLEGIIPPLIPPSNFVDQAIGDIESTELLQIMPSISIDPATGNQFSHSAGGTYFESIFPPQLGELDLTSHQMPTEYQPQHQPEAVRPLARKRAPKTATMSAQKWAPAEARIRQLFLDEERSYKDLMAIINREFGFCAKERQYKAKIKNMKLKRSVEARDQLAIVRRIQHRRHALGKETQYIRVRGHRITEEKLQRWEREHRMLNASQSLPSLPSEISLQTRSYVKSLTPSVLNMPNENLPLAHLVIANQNMDTPVIRLFKHLQELGPTLLKLNQSAAIFNDFQQILSFDYCNLVKPKHLQFYRDLRSPAIEEDILKARNWMNLMPKVRLAKESQEMIQITHCSNQRLFKNGSQIARRCATWRTPYGMILAMFWPTQTPSDHRSSKKKSLAEDSIMAKIAISSSDTGLGSFRIVFDLDPRLNQPATITYQATIPNNSEVFKVIELGKLEDLLKLLEAKTASLTDRDEEGRSLLNYAKRFGRAEFCRFLLNKNFDPNAVELNGDGFLVHVFNMNQYRAIRRTQREQYGQTECYKLMLEAGADFGEQIDGARRYYEGENGFQDVIRYESCTILENVIRFGQPFVSPNTLVEIFERYWRSPLISLVGYTAFSCLHRLEKAILFLRWGVAISCRDWFGYNVLHIVLSNPAYRSRRHLAHIELEELLKLFIAAGADVYELTDAGDSPSRLARAYGWKNEWINALKFCGFDAEEIWRNSMEMNEEFVGPRQTSKVSFEEYYQEWERKGKAEWERMMNGVRRSWEVKERMSEAELERMSEQAKRIEEEQERIGEVVDRMTEAADRMTEATDKMTEVVDRMVVERMREVVDGIIEVADKLSEALERSSELLDRMKEVADRMIEVAGGISKTGNIGKNYSDGENSSNEERAGPSTHGSVEWHQGPSTTVSENVDFDNNDPAEIWQGKTHDIMPHYSHENQVETWESALEESADHASPQTNQPANNPRISFEPHDPMLNEELETLSQFSSFRNINDGRLLNGTSVAEVGSSGEPDFAYDDAFRIHFDDFMRSD